MRRKRKDEDPPYMTIPESPQGCSKGHSLISFETSLFSAIAIIGLLVVVFFGLGIDKAIWPSIEDQPSFKLIQQLIGPERVDYVATAADGNSASYLVSMQTGGTSEKGYEQIQGHSSTSLKEAADSALHALMLHRETTDVNVDVDYDKGVIKAIRSHSTYDGDATIVACNVGDNTCSCKFSSYVYNDSEGVRSSYVCVGPSR